MTAKEVRIELVKLYHAHRGKDVARDVAMLRAILEAIRIETAIPPPRV